MNELIYESVVLRVFKTKSLDELSNKFSNLNGQSYYAVIAYNTQDLSLSLEFRDSSRLNFDAIYTLTSIFGSEYEYIGNKNCAMTPSTIKIDTNDLSKTIKVVENIIARAII